MKRIKIAFLLVLATAWGPPVQAQIFFRKSAPIPSQRVPELILTVKTDADERKRARAAEELRDYDAMTFTEIVPVLVDVLKNDKKMSVRLEALNSLAKLRPIHNLTLPAIEKAAAEDEAWRVRWQAKASLTKLQVTSLVTRRSEPTAAKKKTDETPMGPNTFTVEVMPPQADAVARPMPPGEPPVISPPVPTSAPRPLPRSVQPSPSVPGLSIPTPPANPPTQGPQLFP